MIYNKRETLYFKLAQKLQKQAEELNAEAQEDFKNLQIRNESGALDVEIDPSIFEYGQPPGAVAQLTDSEKENVPDVSSVSSLSSAVDLSQSTSTSSNSSGNSANAHRKRAASDEDPLDSIKKRTRSGIKATRSLNTRSLRSRQVEQPLPDPSTTPSPAPSLSTTSRKRKRTASPINMELPSPLIPPTSTSTPRAQLRRKRGATPLLQKPKEQTIEKYFIKQLIKPKEQPIIKDFKEEPVQPTKKPKEQPSRKTKEQSITSTEKPVRTKNQPSSSASALAKLSTSNAAASTTLPPPSSAKPPAIKFINNELVWARVRGFPPHPASIVDPRLSKKKIPENVLALTKTDKDHVLVEFFQVSDSHMW